jgi:hypothetical protein
MEVKQKIPKILDHWKSNIAHSVRKHEATFFLAFLLVGSTEVAWERPF